MGRYAAVTHATRPSFPPSPNGGYDAPNAPIPAPTGHFRDQHYKVASWRPSTPFGGAQVDLWRLSGSPIGAEVDYGRADRPPHRDRIA
ncbi:hypothetical protein GCM10009682_32450 [Luedemannella flava]|uniref:Uncharacterized protein n=1 Tax=Luedemannella flava TaxID=349316 RepID=A0ABN2M6G1_9ACTN